MESIISKKDIMKLPLKKVLKENTTLDNRISFKNTYMCNLKGKSAKENKRKTSNRHPEHVNMVSREPQLLP